MNTLHRKLLRDLANSRGLLAAIVSIVVVGVMCFITMQSAYRNLESARIRYYRQCRMADFWIDIKKAPRIILGELKRDYPNWDFQGRIQFMTWVNLPDIAQPVNAQLLSVPNSTDSQINRLVLQRGSSFSQSDAAEVIVNDRFARQHDFQVGDRISLVINQQEQELLIVGTAISSEFTYLLGPGAIMPDPKTFGIFYLPEKLMEQRYSFEGACNQIIGHSSRSLQPPEGLLKELEYRLEPYGVFARTPLADQTSHQFLTNEIQGLKSFATVLPLVFLVVAALVLNILVSRLVRQQRPIIGTLKALGYRDRQISFHFLQLGFVVGLLGGLLGSVLGYVLSIAMTRVYGLYFEFPDLSPQWYWSVHGIGWAASLVCALLGCWNGARHALQLQPAEAMRTATPRPIGHVRFAHWLPGWNRWTPAWRFAIRNLWRQRSRTIVAIFSCSMGAGLLVSGLMMLASQDYLIDFQFYKTQRSHLDLSFADFQTTDALHELKSMREPQMVEPILHLGGDLIHGHRIEKIGIQGLIRGARLTRPHDTRGEPIQMPPTGLVIDEKLAEKLQVHVGDVIQFKPARGDRRVRAVPISRVSQGYLGLSCYAELTYLSQLMDEPFIFSGAQLRMDGSSQDLVHLLAELKRRPEIKSVIGQREITENLRETLLQNQWVMISTLVLFSGVVYFGSILNASLVSLAERQREVATLRAIGYSPRSIGSMFLRENLITNLAGTMLGLPIGYGLTQLTAYAFNNDLIRIPVVAPPWIWGVAILTGLIFGGLAHTIVQSSIQRFAVVDALKLKE